VIAHHAVGNADSEISAIGFDAAWQSFQWKDAQRRRAART
jgi:hypothetical protein